MLIIIDETPLSKNKYVNMHWSKRADYKARIGWIILEFKKFEQSIKPTVYAELPYAKAKIIIDIFFKTKRKRDVANYLGGGLVAILDILVDLGFIIDDNVEVIGQPLVFFHYDKEFPRTEIRIEAKEMFNEKEYKQLMLGSAMGKIEEKYFPKGGAND